MNPLHGDGYSFWSGIGNDIPIYLIGVVPMFIAIYKRDKCHVHHCWRIGRHPYKHYRLCKKHHPDVPAGDVTYNHIMELHKQSKEK